MADYGVRITFFSEGKTTVEFLGGDAAETALNAEALVELGESNDVIAQALADVGLSEAKAKPPKKTSKRRARDEEEEPDDDDDEDDDADDDDDDDEEEEAPRKRRTGTRKSPAKKTGTRTRRS